MRVQPIKKKYVTITLVADELSDFVQIRFSIFVLQNIWNFF